MIKEKSLEILDNCLKQLEAIPEDELFDYLYKNSPSFRKALKELEVKDPDRGACLSLD
jgi:hypothetical protein